MLWLGDVFCQRAFGPFFVLGQHSSCTEVDQELRDSILQHFFLHGSLPAAGRQAVHESRVLALYFTENLFGHLKAASVQMLVVCKATHAVLKVNRWRWNIKSKSSCNLYFWWGLHRNAVQAPGGITMMTSTLTQKAAVNFRGAPQGLARGRPAPFGAPRHRRRLLSTRTDAAAVGALSIAGASPAAIGAAGAGASPCKRALHVSFAHARSL